MQSRQALRIEERKTSAPNDRQQTSACCKFEKPARGTNYCKANLVSKLRKHKMKPTSENAPAAARKVSMCLGAMLKLQPFGPDPAAQRNSSVKNDNMSASAACIRCF
jgi:hypothetical protein